MRIPELYAALSEFSWQNRTFMRYMLHSTIEEYARFYQLSDMERSRPPTPPMAQGSSSTTGYNGWPAPPPGFFEPPPVSSAAPGARSAGAPPPSASPAPHPAGPAYTSVEALPGPHERVGTNPGAYPSW